MKKLIYLFAFGVLSLTSTTAFAQEVKEVKEKVQKTIQDKVEVQIGDLPEAVTKTLGEKFAEYTAEKAYKITYNKKEIYYIDLIKEEKSIKTVIDSKGNIIEE